MLNQRRVTSNSKFLSRCETSWSPNVCLDFLVNYSLEAYIFGSPLNSSCCCNRNESLVIVAKEFLKLPILLMIVKQNSLSLSRNLALATFGELRIVFSTKLNLLYLIYLTDCSCCFLLLIKQNCLLKTLLRSHTLMT